MRSPPEPHDSGWPGCSFPFVNSLRKPQGWSEQLLMTEEFCRHVNSLLQFSVIILNIDSDQVSGATKHRHSHYDVHLPHIRAFPRRIGARMRELLRGLLILLIFKKHSTFHNTPLPSQSSEKHGILMHMNMNWKRDIRLEDCFARARTNFLSHSGTDRKNIFVANYCCCYFIISCS